MGRYEFAGVKQLRRLLDAVMSVGADLSLPVTLRQITEAATDLGHAYLAGRVFEKAAAGENFTNPVQAANIWNHLGPRTKAALYTPEQISNVDDFLELADHHHLPMQRHQFCGRWHVLLADARPGVRR